VSCKSAKTAACEHRQQQSKEQCNHSTMLKTTHSTGWKSEQLQQLQNEMKQTITYKGASSFILDTICIDCRVSVSWLMPDNVRVKNFLLLLIIMWGFSQYSFLVVRLQVIPSSVLWHSLSDILTRTSSNPGQVVVVSL